MHAQKQHFDCLSSAHKDSHFNEFKLSCIRSLCCGNSYCFCCYFFISCNKIFYLFLWPQMMFLTLFGFAYSFSCLVYFIHAFTHLLDCLFALVELEINVFFYYTVSLYAITFFFFHIVRITKRKKSKFTFNAFLSLAHFSPLETVRILKVAWYLGNWIKSVMFTAKE